MMSNYRQRAKFNQPYFLPLIFRAGSLHISNHLPVTFGRWGRKVVWIFFLLFFVFWAYEKSEIIAKIIWKNKYATSAYEIENEKGPDVINMKMLEQPESELK